MLYAIGENKIIRADNDGNTVAEVHFELVSPGIYEITEILTAATDGDDKDLDKLMFKTADHMRKNHNKVITHDEFALEWFHDHPEAKDVLANMSKSSQKSVQKSDAKQARVSEKAANKPVKTPKHTDRNAVSDARSAEELNLGRNELTEDELPSKGARVAGRVFQIICALAMLAIAGTFAFACFENMTKQVKLLEDNAAAIIAFKITCLAFVAFALLMSLWILSRKRYTVDGESIRLDTGRGIFAFALIVIALIAAPTFISFTTSTIANASSHVNVYTGLGSFFNVFNVYAYVLAILSIGGLVLSIVRQFIGR